MEKELNAAKRFNKIAMAVIIVMLILMSIMVSNMRYLAEPYEMLESKYEQLYEDLKDGIEKS